MKFFFQMALFALCILSVDSDETVNAVEEIVPEEEDFHLVEEEAYYSEDEEDYYSEDKEDYDSENEEEDNKWKISGRFADFYHNFGCENMFEKPRPITGQPEWEKLRSIYKSLTTPENNTLPEHQKSGLVIDYEVRQSPGKGRGVFTKQDIQKGDLVYTPRQHAQFESGAAYRQYLLKVKDELPDLVCDVMQWTSVENVGEGTYIKYKRNAEDVVLRICCDLCDSALSNDGDYDDEANFGMDPEGGETWLDRSKLYALRDIKAGEELLCDYGEWSLGHEWRSFGM